VELVGDGVAERPQQPRWVLGLADFVLDDHERSGTWTSFRGGAWRWPE
jgi:hypothetical protein